ALVQGLEGDLLVLDLNRRQFGEAGGDRARMPRGGSECKGAVGAERMLGPSDGLVTLIILLNRSRRVIRAQLLFAGDDESKRTVSEVDVDEVLGVEGVNKALTCSHVGWGKDGEAGLYTGEDEGRLCTLVHAQLIVMHPYQVQFSWFVVLTWV
ncbi:hypothetical protein POSPLADRAFT_1132869, partial [Postia placenta MAD-698-R-SB12]